MTKEMVFVEERNLDKGEILTTTFIIAEHAGITHKSIRDNISNKWKEDLEEFGRLRFKKEPFETNGGIQEQTYYELNEQQATLLFTYLRNTEQVKKFKKLLVKAFFKMREELLKRKETRDIAKIDRNNMTKMICESGEQERMHNRGISTYTDLVYKSIFSLSKKNLIISRGIEYKKELNLREFLSEEEIEQVRQREVLVSELLKLNYDYFQIKGFLKV